MDKDTRLEIRNECKEALEELDDIVGSELNEDDEYHLNLLIERIQDDAPNYTRLTDVLGRFGSTLRNEYGYSTSSDAIKKVGEAQEKLEKIRKDEQL